MIGSTKARAIRAGLDKSQVIATYRLVSPFYDAWAHVTESRAREVCIRKAGVRDGEAVLEVAVGTGLLFAEVVKRNPRGRNAGVDLTDAMIKRAEGRLQKLGLRGYSLEVGDAYSLPFAGEAFDVVINSYMFDLLPEEDFCRVLSEFRRVLKPGGRVVLVNMAENGSWLSAAWGVLYRISPALLGGCRPVALARAVEEAGFEQVEREEVRQLGFVSEVLLARKPEGAGSVAARQVA